MASQINLHGDKENALISRDVSGELLVRSLDESEAIFIEALLNGTKLDEALALTLHVDAHFQFEKSLALQIMSNLWFACH